MRRGAWQILSGFGVRTVARILLIVFVAKLYGVSDFGRLGETVAIVELAAALATFGLNKTLLGRLAGDDASDESKIVLEALAITACVSFLVTGALWVLWALIAGQTDGGTRIALMGIPLIALTEIALTATRHRRTVAWDTIVKAAVKPWSFLLFALTGYLWAGGEPSSTQTLILAYVASLTLSAVIAIGALFFASRFTLSAALRHFSLSDTFRLARDCLPIAVNETAVFAFRRIDIILLALVAGPAATGIYYLAQQIGTVVEKVRYLFEPMLAPIVAQTNSLDIIGYHLRRLCLGIFTTQLAILVLIAILGQPLLDWLGAGFAAGLTVALVVLVGELFDGSFGLCELPTVYRHPHWPPRLVLAALVLEIGLVWLLASHFGALGAATGFATAMLLLAIARLMLIRRLYGLSILGKRYGVALLTGAVAAVSVLFGFRLSSDHSMLTAIAASVSFLILYGGGLWLFPRNRAAGVSAANPA
ncbi:polysaccharide biosynthesis protein [Parasphingopyxis algicola]|uniref:oligosaccharide flippase family protein n=1 Tax=Parasphingopyxis algicola TaxID=2026624 RepID=UPI0015A20333|nr:oligosaccharide flippase family protein [Parasphingopyxis algicola]QLC24407.1 polysaccharide biosynthesis protein [Parasphingopyxis algicola]